MAAAVSSFMTRLGAGDVSYKVEPSEPMIRVTSVGATRIPPVANVP